MSDLAVKLEREISEYFQRYSSLVYRRALVLLGSVADAEDAVQEVFVRAAKNLECFRGESRVSTWLYRITTNYCLSHIRNHSRQRHLLQERYENALTFAGAPAPAETLALRQLLGRAEPNEAHAAVYVYIDGMTRPEAAAALDVSVRTIGNLLNRFGQWAREELGDLERLGLGNIDPNHKMMPDSAPLGVSTSERNGNDT